MASSLWQRWWYRGMNADLEREARSLDGWLRSPAARPLWIGMTLAPLLLWGALRAAGASPAWAAALALLFTAGGLMAARRAWLQPERFSPRTLLRLGALMMLATYAGV